VTIIGPLVKLSFGHTHVSELADELEDALEALGRRGGLHELDRKPVKLGTRSGHVQT
jgi:hypothetical protein